MVVQTPRIVVGIPAYLRSYSYYVYCCWLRNNSRPDVPSHEVYLVDPSSCWVCHIQQFLDERLLVLHFYELAVEVHDIALRRIQNS